MAALKVKEYVRLSTAAKEIGFPARTLRHWAQTGKIEGQKLFDNWVFDREYLEEWKSRNALKVQVK